MRARTKHADHPFEGWNMLEKITFLWLQAVHEEWLIWLSEEQLQREHNLWGNLVMLRKGQSSTTFLDIFLHSADLSNADSSADMATFCLGATSTMYGEMIVLAIEDQAYVWVKFLVDGQPTVAFTGRGLQVMIRGMLLEWMGTLLLSLAPMLLLF
jgi:hypothetical protein